MIHRAKAFTFPPGVLSDALFELIQIIPDTLFWIKNTHLQIVALNDTFAERVNRPPNRILGLTDRDLYFPELAEQFSRDDYQVITSGTPIRDKYELLTLSGGGVEWRRTTKVPIRAKNGRIIGTTGISRPLDPRFEGLPSPHNAIARIIHLARESIGTGINVPALARAAGMSTPTLNRRFREILGISPGSFLHQLRISRASGFLRSSPLSITEIALEVGYESPAAFSRAFSRQMHVSPSRYRNDFGFADHEPSPH